MMSLTIIQLKHPFLFTQFFQRLEEGGMFFMFPILLMLLLVLFLIIKGVLATKKDDLTLQKNIKLLNSVGLLAVVWGMLGQLIGLVGMFDQVEMISDLSTGILAGGLKVSALPPIFGFCVFVISRVASIVLTWITKEI